MVPEALKAFADEAIRHPGVVVAVFATDGSQLRWLLARSGDVPLNLAELTSDLLPLIQARGGGSPRRIQGGGNQPEGIEAFLQRFKEKILQEQRS
jgi:alanyl-tRNA synthetase